MLYAEAGANETNDIRFKCSAHMANNLTIQEVSKKAKYQSFILRLQFHTDKVTNTTCTSNNPPGSPRLKDVEES